MNNGQGVAAGSTRRGRSPLRCRLLGVGAMNSPRYAPAGLLLEFEDTRVMFDGGPGAAPGEPLDAWLVTDEQAELRAALSALARPLRVTPVARDFDAPGIRVERMAVAHTSHPAFGYRFVVEQGVVVWAPEFIAFPKWAAGADLMFADAAGWRRPIWFAGRVGGHMAALDVAQEAQNLRIGRLVLAHIGRPTIRALEQGERPPFGSFGEDGELYVLDRRGRVRRYPRRETARRTDREAR